MRRSRSSAGPRILCRGDFRLVPDGAEVEAFGGGAILAFGGVGIPEEAFDPREGFGVRRRPREGAGQQPNHAIEESVSGELQGNERTFLDHANGMNGSNGVGLYVAAIGGERCEVVGSREEVCRGAEGVWVEGFGVMPRAEGFERAHDAIIPDAVLVGFARGTESGVKPRRHGLHPSDSNRGGEMSVEGHAPRFGSMEWGDVIDGGDLSGGVDAGIGSSGSVNGHGSSRESLKRFFEGVLNAASGGLVLPTAELGSVVLDGEFEDGPGRHGMNRMSRKGAG